MKYTKHHTSKEGLKSEIWKQKAVCYNCLFCPVKTVMEGQWFVGPNLSPQGGTSCAGRTKPERKCRVSTASLCSSNPECFIILIKQ